MNSRENPEDKIVEIEVGRSIVKVPDDVNEYSLRVPSLKELEDAKLGRMKFYSSLIQSPDYKTKGELTKIYKDRGIDIEKYKEEIKEINKELVAEYLALAKVMNKEDSDSKIAEFKVKIREYQLKIHSILTKEGELFVNSIDSLVEERYNYILISLISEVKQDGIWVRLFNSVEEFENDKRAEYFIPVFSKFYYGYGGDEVPFV